MKEYFLVLNGVIVSGYFTYGHALNAFRRKMLHISSGDMLAMVGANGHCYASSY